MIYLDYNATAPLRGGVLEAMLPYLRQATGNASSAHAAGRAARAAVERARRAIAAADLVDNCCEIIAWTSAVNGSGC